MEKVMQLKTIKEYNDYMGVETRHPLVSVIEGSRMPHPVPHARKHVGMYVIFLKELRCTDDLTYGRRSYDFQENTLLFIAPGQVFGHEAVSVVPSRPATRYAARSAYAGLYVFLIRR